MLPALNIFTEGLSPSTIVCLTYTHKDIAPKFYKGNDPRLKLNLAHITTKRLLSATANKMAVSWTPYKTAGFYTKVS